MTAAAKQREKEKRRERWEKKTAAEKAAATEKNRLCQQRCRQRKRMSMRTIAKNKQTIEATEKAKKSHRASQRRYAKRKLAGMTEAELEEMRKYRREKSQRCRDRMPREKHNAMLAKRRETYRLNKTKADDLPIVKYKTIRWGDDLCRIPSTWTREDFVKSNERMKEQDEANWEAEMEADWYREERKRNGWDQIRGGRNGWATSLYRTLSSHRGKKRRPDFPSSFNSNDEAGAEVPLEAPPANELYRRCGTTPDMRWLCGLM